MRAFPHAVMAIALGVTACTPAELVLRQPEINWKGLGVTTVGVETATNSGAVAAPAALSDASAQAAELLSFALAESAFDVRPASASSAVLAVAVTKLEFVKAATDGSDDQQPGSDGDPTPSQVDSSTGAAVGFAEPGGLAIRAVLDIHLLAPGKLAPLWSGQAIGTVAFERPLTLFSSPPASASLDPRTTALLQDLAVQRALAQVVRELLPRYEYQDLDP